MPGLVGYTTVPIEWPEQQVKIVEEDVTPTAHVTYIDLGTAKMMEVRVPTLNSGDEARAIVTFEVQRSAIEPPGKTDQYVLPDVKKLDRGIRIFLARVRRSRAPTGRSARWPRKSAPTRRQAWEKVETIYDWVREKVKYKNGPLKGALAALGDGTGDCEELTSLFIAICRAGNIPARTVWVEGHCYPEFYLLDDKGEGHWFPVPGGRQPGVRRHSRVAPRALQGRQLPSSLQSLRHAALSGRSSHRQRRHAPGEVHPQVLGGIARGAAVLEELPPPTPDASRLPTRRNNSCSRLGNVYRDPEIKKGARHETTCCNDFGAGSEWMGDGHGLGGAPN